MEENQEKSISVDRAIFDNIDNLFFLIDESGKIISYNFQVKVQLFYSDSQLAHKNIFELIQENNHDHLKQILLQIQTEGSSHSKAIELSDSFGKYTKYKLSMSLEKDSPDSGTVFIILGQKIAPPNKYANLLEFPENLLPTGLFMDKIFDESRYGIMVFDRNGFVLQVNRVIFNYWSHEMLHNYNLFEDPTFKKNGIIEKLQEVLTTRIPAQTKPFLYNTHDYDPSFPDKPIWLQVMIFTLSEDSHSPPRIVLMFRDTTERIEKEISLETHQKLLEGLLTKRALAEKTLAHISSRFVKPEAFISSHNFNAMVKDSLQEIGEFSQADEVFIIQTQDILKSTAVSLTHEWCRTPKICLKGQIQNIPFTNYSWWASLFTGDTPIVVTHDYNPGRLGPHFEDLIEAYNISTLAVYTLQFQKKIVGLVGIVSIQESLEWKESDFTVLQVFSDMLGNYFERFQTFQALSKTEAKYRTLIETTSEPIYMIDPQGIFLFTNSATAKVLGYPLSHFKSLPISSLLHPEDNILCNVAIDSMLTQTPPSSIQNLEFRLRNQKGAYLWFAVNITPVMEKDSSTLSTLSHLSHLVCVSRNVTEIKQKEREIRDHELQIQYNSVISMVSSMLISNMPDLEKKMQDILPTLGHIMPKSCNLIALLRPIPDSNQSQPEKFEMSGLWTSPEFQMDQGEFEAFLSTSLLTPLTEQLPEKLYRNLSLPSFSQSIQDQARKYQLRSILSVPIFARSQLYGILMVNSRTDYTFSQKETTLFLNVGILIGFAIQNQLDQSQKLHFYEALHDSLNAAVFIVQDNKYIYVNRAFEQLTGHSASLLYGFDNLFSHTDSSNEEVITKLRRAWAKSPRMGVSVEFEIQRPEKSIPCYITLSKGYFEGKEAIFGIITERTLPIA